MYFLRLGDGKQVVVFLHGWGARGEIFKWFAGELKKDYMVVIPDFNGFGKSEDPDSIWGVREYSENLFNLLNELNLKKVTLVGHSFGGRVAIKFCKMYPGCVDRLILVNSAGIRPKRGFKYFIRVMRYKYLKRAAAHNPKLAEKLKGFGSKDYKALNDSMKKVFIKVVNEDLKPDMLKIKTKTLIIWGEKDLETPLYMAKKINKYIKGSELIIIKDAAHFSFLDKPRDFILILRAFLKE